MRHRETSQGSACSWLILIGAMVLGNVSTSEAKPFVFEGIVVGVSDGDTLTVRSDTHETLKVRLHGIDAPERHQPFGDIAKQYTAAYVFGKRVRVTARARDRYGRIVGNVTVGRHSLEEDLVRDGFAWWYHHFDPKNERLKQLEADARMHRRGLWIDPHPIAPWEFRRNRTKQVRSAPPMRREALEKPLSTTPLHPQPSALPLRGNTRSRIAHRSGCHDYACAHCTLVFSTEADMIRAGYRLHRACANVALPPN